MEFRDVIRARRSVRRYQADMPVTEEQVQTLLEAAVASPSAGNRQPWHFYVVRDSAIKEGLAAAAGQGFVADAPVIIVVCADPERSAARYASRGRDLYAIQDTAIATTYMMLAATDMGLATCWIGAFDEARAAAVLDLPGHLRPVAMLPVGHPAREVSGRTSRRPLGEVVTFVE